MRGPGLNLLFTKQCSACLAVRPLFNLDASRLVDYALVYRVCRYCLDRLRAQGEFGEARDRVPFFVINAYGWRTSRARRAAIPTIQATTATAEGDAT